MRVGIGYDVHPLILGRKLMLGGVEIPSDKGLSGYSDADVLAHAIIDALLGAAGLGDIGSQFPAADPKYKDISSLILMGETKKLVEAQDFKIVNIDATIIAQRPKLSPFIEKMRYQISQALGVEVTQVAVKATSGEGLGFIGREEGVCAQAVALIDTI